VKSWRVLVVSESALFADALSRLLHEAGIQVVTQVGNCEEAQAILAAQNIHTVVVDYDERRQDDTEIIIRFAENSRSCHVVLLTMVNNKMIVYHRESVENVTPADLIEAIRFPTFQPKDPR
jgi:DNA-binding NarL/FixJ family response regulator